MKCNVGKTDRIVRVIIGLAIIWAGFYYENWWGALGVVFLIPAAIGHCPLYVPFKFSTCRKAMPGRWDPWNTRFGRSVSARSCC